MKLKEFKCWPVPQDASYKKGQFMIGSLDNLFSFPTNGYEELVEYSFEDKIRQKLYKENTDVIVYEQDYENIDVPTSLAAISNIFNHKFYRCDIAPSKSILIDREEDFVVIIQQMNYNSRNWIYDDENASSLTQNSIKVRIVGPLEKTRDFLDRFVIAETKQKIAKLDWHYILNNKSQGIHSINLSSVAKVNVIDEMYPYIKEGLEKFFDDYMKSSSNILLFMGEPGTGKTTLLRDFISKRNLNCRVTFDKELMINSSFYIGFLTSSKEDLLIAEDADPFLMSREKGDNEVMSKLLNMSDGIIKLPNKKLIFTTNLTSISRIDPAILRPGRCYRVVNFRSLTQDETNTLCAKINISPPINKDSYTLANIFNQNIEEMKVPKIGF